MRFDLNAALMAFRLIATHSSFTRAAAQLNVSPSALSQTLRQLETHLGVRLCDRTTRQVNLTEAGHEFLARITPALSEIEQAIDALRQNRNRPAGTLRLTLPRVASRLVLKPLLGAFMQAYPDIRLDLDISDGLRDVVADGFDAGIRLGEVLQGDMMAIPLGGPIMMAVVGSPAYFAEHGRPQTPDDLQQHICLCYRFVSSGAVYRWEFAEPLLASLNPSDSVPPRRQFEVTLKGQLTVNDNDLRVETALNGAGLAYTFEPTVRDLLVNGQLESVLDEWQIAYPGFYLYYPNREFMSPKLRVFIDFIRGCLDASLKKKPLITAQ